MKYYKFLQKNHRGEHSKYLYSKEYLPQGDNPGEWLPYIEELIECKQGYHACTKKNLLDWASDDLYEVEFKGKAEHGNTKVVSHQMRFIRKIETWNEQSARLFAVWCAKQVLKNYEKQCPNDNRVRECIEVSERYAYGKATLKELQAVRSAVWSALSAAWSAVRSASESAASSLP